MGSDRLGGDDHWHGDYHGRCAWSLNGLPPTRHGLPRSYDGRFRKAAGNLVMNSDLLRLAALLVVPLLAGLMSRAVFHRCESRYLGKRILYLRDDHGNFDEIVLDPELSVESRRQLVYE